ncbi:uncharacterized protein LOC121869027 [Homarus americanus]|uniref:uncharacterized protein LOC121869027 n=1 Tax=Homarus americanus TaxID=6706 RepID=UPI001C457CEF|nr:uncharacterized protein LOC121869027 [Homarus americanus]
MPPITPPFPPWSRTWVWVVLVCGCLLHVTAVAVNPPVAGVSTAVPSSAEEHNRSLPDTTHGDNIDHSNSTVTTKTPEAAVNPTTIPVLTTSTEPPRVTVTRENNVTEVTVICSSTPRLFPGLPTPPGRRTTEAADDTAYTTSTLVTLAASGRGVEVDLSQLVDDGGNQLVVDVGGCGRVDVGGGVPGWAEGVVLAIKGSLVLRSGWWAGSNTLKMMWIRVDGGVNGEVGGLCESLPPTLESLDVSQTRMGTLLLDKSCVPPTLQRLEAVRTDLTRLSLCTPTLVSLHVSLNEVVGGLQWAGCEGGVAAVEYLQANSNNLTAASTCGWPGLRTLDLRHNHLAGLDLSSCPPTNLSRVTASRNYLVTPPTLPPTLLYLDLSHNYLTTLPVLTHILMEADLSHNKVMEVGKSRFKHARKLLLLNLAYNHLTQLNERDLAGLRSLRKLDASHNRLRHISPNSFVHLHHLRHLHLQKNHLTTLYARDLAALKPHAHATLQQNPWKCSCSLLADLNSLHSCPTCQHQAEELKCRERGSWVPATTVLHSCLQAVQDMMDVTDGQYLDESDEDISEEEPETLAGGGSGSPKAVLVVPGVVILLLIAITTAMGYRMYHRHRRAITTRLAPFCGFCGYCAPTTVNNNHHNHQQDQLSQMANDSDTETEL